MYLRVSQLVSFGANFGANSGLTRVHFNL